MIRVLDVTQSNRAAQSDTNNVTVQPVILRLQFSFHALVWHGRFAVVHVYALGHITTDQLCATVILKVQLHTGSNAIEQYFMFA